MDGLIGQSDGLIRLAIFGGVFLVMALIELGWPKRPLHAARRRRWLTNIGISVTGSILLRLMAMLAVPIAAVAAAIYAEQHQIGILNHVAWPEWLKIVVTLLVLDLAIWGQHWASHKIPLFWRLHKVHHADRDIDVTTAVRFHPVEIALSMLWKIAVVVPLGAPPLGVFLFEVILNACAMFNHANIALPAWLDGPLRLLMVTPDMHRVHHSVLRREHDSNYGFNLSLWDRLFRTYTAQPEGGHEAMTIGLTPYQSDAPTKFGWSLLLPFIRNAGSAKSSRSPLVGEHDRRRRSEGGVMDEAQDRGEK
jgi:sterol desaturase/sphingolipid hydroxylase (fatty acid hydroxylase superfamily)